MANKSAAAELAEAQADVERIARELYGAFLGEWTADLPAWWEHDESFREGYRRVVRDLLQRDVIRVGDRPAEPEEPIPGQISIDDA